MQLAVHRSWIRPASRIQVHLTLLAHVEKIDHETIGWEPTFAIPIGRRHKLILRGVDGFALNITISSLGKHMRHTRELAVAFIDLVAGCACDNEKGNPVTDLGRPSVFLVESKINCSFRGIVPYQPVATTGNQEWHTHALSANGVVIMPTANFMIA